MINLWLDAVRSDMRATGLTGEIRLIRPDWTPNGVVETWAGDTGWTGGVFFSEAASDLSAHVAVAEQARQAVMESLGYQSTGAVWPACAAHGLGTWPRARHGIGVWWCDGGDGHVSAEIGHWPAWRQPRLRFVPSGRRGRWCGLRNVGPGLQRSPEPRVLGDSTPFLC